MTANTRFCFLTFWHDNGNVLQCAKTCFCIVYSPSDQWDTKRSMRWLLWYCSSALVKLLQTGKKSLRMKVEIVCNICPFWRWISKWNQPHYYTAKIQRLADLSLKVAILTITCLSFCDFHSIQLNDAKSILNCNWNGMISTLCVKLVLRLSWSLLDGART